MEERDIIGANIQIEKELKNIIKVNKENFIKIYNFFKKIDFLDKLTYKKFLRVVYIIQCVKIMRDTYKEDYVEIFSYFLLKAMGAIKYE